MTYQKFVFLLGATLCVASLLSACGSAGTGGSTSNNPASINSPGAGSTAPVENSNPGSLPTRADGTR